MTLRKQVKERQRGGEEEQIKEGRRERRGRDPSCLHAARDSPEAVKEISGRMRGRDGEEELLLLYCYYYFHNYQ